MKQGSVSSSAAKFQAQQARFGHTAGPAPHASDSAANVTASGETSALRPITKPASAQHLMYRQGDRVVVTGAKRGVVQFVGALDGLGPGLWVGVQFDEAVGSITGGKVQGRKVFDCPLKHGGFYHIADVAADPEAEKLEVGVEDSSYAANEPVSFAHDDEPYPDATSAINSVASGRGLHTAVVNQVSQFTITVYDRIGRRREVGGDAVNIFVRGVSAQMLAARCSQLDARS